MILKFKDLETEYTATGVLEQKLFKQGEAVGWLLSLTLSGEIESPELDNILTKENISEISLQTEGGDDAKMIVHFIGYEKLTSCIIRYTDNKSTIEIQIAKGV